MASGKTQHPLSIAPVSVNVSTRLQACVVRVLEGITKIKRMNFFDRKNEIHFIIIRVLEIVVLVYLFQRMVVGGLAYLSNLLKELHNRHLLHLGVVKVESFVKIFLLFWGCYCNILLYLCLHIIGIHLLRIFEDKIDGVGCHLAILSVYNMLLRVAD